MKYVRVHEFVDVLESLGIALPKNSTRATIHLDGGFNGIVRIDCELIMEMFVDVTTLADSSKKPAVSREKVRKRFRLVEETDRDSIAGSVAESVRKAIAHSN